MDSCKQPNSPRQRCVTTCRGCSKRGKVTWALVSRLTAHWTNLQSPVPPEVVQILTPGDQRHSYQIEYSKGLEVAFEEAKVYLSLECTGFGQPAKVDLLLYSSIKTTRVLIQKLLYSKCKGCSNVNISVYHLFAILIFQDWIVPIVAMCSQLRVTFFFGCFSYFKNFIWQMKNRTAPNKVCALHVIYT